MKVYVVEYDFEIAKSNSFDSDTEQRIRTFTDVTEFINEVKRIQDKWYISNIKTHVGETKEVELDKVLNPF